MKKLIDSTGLVGNTYDLLGLEKKSPLLRRVKILIEAIQSVDVGGCEGSKFLMIVLLQELGRITYFAKEYKYNARATNKFDFSSYENTLSKVAAVVEAYTLLRKKGYLVPEFAAYFINTQTETMYMISSDMTEGGKYIVWGLSDSMTDVQNQDFVQMKITPDDYSKIKRLVSDVVKQANRDRVYLDCYHFHLRQEKKTRKFEICLLDVSMAVIKHTHRQADDIALHNMEESRVFLEAVLQGKNNVL
ncbi:MAG: hypothetical protein BroJett025_01390 [Patescibacteria group bacterium]|nr:MAG: hypothetical protein BroJett025_01390 [Patescibacteria group bacterium]